MIAHGSDVSGGSTEVKTTHVVKGKGITQRGER